MEPSPLTQVSRPDTFQPKIVKLYGALFQLSNADDEQDHEQSEGFWQEFFLLKPDPPSLRRVLHNLSPDQMLHLQIPAQQLFSRAIDRMQDARAPKAIRVALSITSGAYSTGLISYFTHRDLFPSLMKFVQDTELSGEISEPFILLGLLTNYNKFEFQNPYRLRLDDFVNDVAIKKTVQCVGNTCRDLRDKYVAVQDDTPEAWSFGTALNYVGLGALTGSRPASPAPSPEEAQSLFTTLPGPEAAILLSAYDFANANKLFCFNLINLPAASKTDITPFSAFLSLTSYLFQHAHRSARTALYSHVNLYILQIVIEDPALAKRICSEESKTPVRLCRQRQPFLPIVRTDRVLAAYILDMVIDGINHNLRRRLDTEYYMYALDSNFRQTGADFLTYHWSELWRSLLSFIRFLATYANDIKSLRESSRLIDDTVNLVALSLSAGESFLPDAAAYDDLFYKLVETGDILTKFRDAYDLSKQSDSSSIETLVSVSKHYHALLEGDEKGKVKSKNLSPREVSKVIKQGYETLSIQAREDLDHWERYREADHKVVLKKVSRAAVEDAKTLVLEK
ncbi:hypothetical protein UCDDS831_g03646 [Diplodia seriata]|uniref:Armadillo-like helical domain-containing protein n=1 Tax=Diplodia seriata TaxID=420778 RepID=A0A0G2EJW1_9PEZI|nr:hypothetical protein UCDDS831_g03646 [Diplodia seriata]